MKAMSERKYPLEWLDTLIETLKSYPTERYKKNDNSSLQGIDFLSYADKELSALKLRIKEEIFAAVSHKKNRKLVANYYHETITYYMNILYGIGQDAEAIGTKIKELCSELHYRLRQLVDFLETHFHDYLKNNRKVPKYYLSSAKKNLSGLLDKITERSRKSTCTHTKNVIQIVTDALEKFISQSKHPYIITDQCVQYRLDLLKKIEALPQWEPDVETGQFPLDSLLIFMNFNSKTYISYLTSCLSDSIKNADTDDKTELLLGYYKGFRQLHTHPAYAFNPEYHSIMDLLDKWFDEELSYFRKITTFTPVTVGKSRESTVKEKPPASGKVLCTLSGDQIALLLRAADEVRMLSARSLTAVFRSIVPHLATKQKDELSYESIRIKSYNAEETDKEVTIRTLRRMIEKIQDY